MNGSAFLLRPSVQNEQSRPLGDLNRT
ncbi:MAG TPA: hypothetical protein DCY36_10980 [Acidimicrobiaceae bacterium]|nr:hypothetical protein [Acidimicrobiaceae bacterium]